MDEIRKDAALALTLASHGHTASRHLVAALRDRLTAAVVALEPEAAAFTNHPDHAAHQLALRQAQHVARTQRIVDDPAHGLRLLAKAAETTMRLSAGHRHTSRPS